MSTALDRAALLDQLAGGVAALTSSPAWRRYLDVQSRFHRYSFNNVLLIAAQRPEASLVAGFGAWRRLGRTVRRGERAIWIVAPLVSRTGSAEDRSERPIVRRFRFVPVFDVSQTEGEPLPEVCRRLEGDPPERYYRHLVDVARSAGFAVREHRFGGSTNGDCSHPRRLIRIESAISPAQRVKTLAHEVAHALLHEQFEDRARAELEAESVAYVVCRVFGIDSGSYSFGYVATWAGGGPEALAGIRTSGERIHAAASGIVGSLGEVPAVVPGTR